MQTQPSSQQPFKHPEAQYIEQKLLVMDNYKKFKITEEDLTKFEDDQVSLNVANLYLDYFVWNNHKDILILPSSIFKKFSGNAQSVKCKIFELMGAKSICDFNSILILHEDKFSKKDYSFILIQSLKNVSRSEGQAVAIIGKEINSQLSDSEIDALICLRKILSMIINKEINKEILPCKMVQVEPQYTISFKTQSQLMSLIFTIQHTLPAIQQSPLIKFTINDSMQEDLKNKMRELLYFLYDYKFFETFNILNESSIIIKRQSIDPCSSESSMIEQQFEDDPNQSFKNQSEFIFEENQQNNLQLQVHKNGSLFYKQRLQQQIEPTEEPDIFMEDQQTYTMQEQRIRPAEEVEAKEAQNLYTIYEEDGESQIFSNGNTSQNVSYFRNKALFSSGLGLSNNHCLSMDRGEADYDQLQQITNLTNENIFISNDSRQDFIDMNFQQLIKSTLNDQLPTPAKNEHKILKPKCIEINLTQAKLPQKLVQVPPSLKKEIKCEFIVEAIEFNIPQFFEEIIILQNEPQVLQDQSRGQISNIMDQLQRDEMRKFQIETFFKNKDLGSQRSSSAIDEEILMFSAAQQSSSSVSPISFYQNYKADSKKSSKEIKNKRYRSQSQGNSSENSMISLASKNENNSKLGNVQFVDKENKDFITRIPTPPIDPIKVLDYKSPERALNPFQENQLNNPNPENPKSPITQIKKSAQPKQCKEQQISEQKQRIVQLDFSKLAKGNLQNKLPELQGGFQERRDSQQQDLESLNNFSTQSNLDSERRLRIIKLVKSGKFTFKTNKILKNGRIKYNTCLQGVKILIESPYSSNLIQNMFSSEIPESARKNLQIEFAQSDQQSSSRQNLLTSQRSACKMCDGTNWITKYNMPCNNCVQLINLNELKRDFPNQQQHQQQNVMILDQDE